MSGEIRGFDLTKKEKLHAFCLIRYLDRLRVSEVQHVYTQLFELLSQIYGTCISHNTWKLLSVSASADLRVRGRIGERERTGHVVS